MADTLTDSSQGVLEMDNGDVLRLVYMALQWISATHYLIILFIFFISSIFYIVAPISFR